MRRCAATLESRYNSRDDGPTTHKKRGSFARSTLDDGRVSTNQRRSRGERFPLRVARVASPLHRDTPRGTPTPTSSLRLRRAHARHLDPLQSRFISRSLHFSALKRARLRQSGLLACSSLFPLFILCSVFESVSLSHLSHPSVSLYHPLSLSISSFLFLYTCVSTADEEDPFSSRSALHFYSRAKTRFAAVDLAGEFVACVLPAAAY